MSRCTRRSASQQLIRPSFENKNIFNSSDVDINSKRNSWWKNLSDKDRRRSLLSKNSISINRLNSDSNVSDDENPDWWKNLSESGPISMQLKNITERKNVDHENILEKQISSTDESDTENVFPRKIIFPTQEVRTQKSRFSSVFNLLPEKATQEDHNSEQSDNDLKTEDLNAIENDCIQEISNERRKSKKKRKTKKLFSKNFKKRKYSDMFTVSNTESQENKPDMQKDESPEDNIDILQVEKQDSVTDNVSKEAAVEKKKLFKVNQKKKKYSEAFALLNTTTENEDNVQKEDSNIDVSKKDIEEKKKLFEVNLKKKKYSEVFDIYKSSADVSLSDNETSAEEIVIEEVITQKDTSHAGNHSLRTRNSNSSKSEENIQKRDSTPVCNRSLRTKKNNDFNNESRQNLEEEIVLYEDTIAGNVSKDTVEVKKDLFKVNPKRKKYSEAFALSNTKTKNEDTCVDMVQNEDSNTDIHSRESDEVKKKLFQLNLKKKKYSEAFAISTHENLLHSETSEDEIVIEEVISQKDVSKQSLRTRKSSLAQENEKATTPSDRSLRTRKIILSKIDEKNLRASTSASSRSLKSRTSKSAQVDENLEKASTSTSDRNLKTLKSNSKIDERTQPVGNRSLKTGKSDLNNDSREKLHDSAKSNKEILVQNEDSTADNDLKDTNNKDILQKEDSNEDVSIEDINEKKKLFAVNLKKKKYSEAFAISTHHILSGSDTSEEEIFTDVSTQKDVPLTGNRSLSNSFKMAEKSLQKNTSLKPNESNLSISENKKNLSRRSGKKTIDSSKKEINISEKTPQSSRRTRSSRRNQDSSNEKESNEVGETVLGEDMKTPKQLFSRNQQSKKYSEAFLNIHEIPQNPTQNIEHTEREVSPENIVNKDTEEKLTKPITVHDLISKRKESLDDKNPKCSEAFLELLAMQKPIQEDLHVPSQNIEADINKESTDVVVNQLHSEDDTRFSSIPSIDISHEIKHPLFKHKARKSLYSAKEEQKSIRKSKTQSEEERSTKKISKKRMSLRSTSPTDSLMSKFFEESLISSTKLFINTNGEKSGGSDESAKKKRASKLRKISGMNENVNIVEDKIMEESPLKNTVPIKTVPDTRNTPIFNENKIVNEEIMESVEENSKRKRNTKSLKNISENSKSSISEKSHYAINKNNTQQTIETEEINRISNSPTQISRKSKSSVRNSEVSVKSTSKSRKKSNSLSVIPENIEILNNMNKNTSVNENNNSPYFENAVNDPPENLLTPKGIDYIEKKTSVSKIPRKLSSLSNVPERNTTKNTKSKNIAIDDSSFSDDDPLEILLTPIADLVARRKEHNSTINKESPCNNVISIRSSEVNERLNPNERIENWLSESVMANNIDEEIEFGVDLNPTIRKSNILSAKPKSVSSLSEQEILRRKKLLKSIVELPKDKQKSVPTVPVKKLTDFFRKLDKNEKLKPIPKNTNTVKKVSRPVCTARLIDGKPYYSKKLFRGERWCSSIFYKFLQHKMMDKYGIETINESERVMKSIVQHVKTVIKSKKYLKEEVDKLKIELAQRNIISTHYDFYLFCFNYLPAEYRKLVVPMTQAFTSEPTVPYNEEDVFKKIIVE